MIRPNIDFSESPQCAVGQSQFQGQGLFTLKQIKKGEIVIDYNNTSTLWEKVKFEDMPSINKESCWWVGIDTKYCLLASPESSFMRANHSRNPNLQWYPKEKILLAIGDIKAGEELTFDYRLEIASQAIKQNPPPWA